MGVSYVFHTCAVYRAPGRCQTYHWLIAKREAILARARAAETEKYRAEMAAQADQATRDISAHMQICEGCTAWIEALTTRRGLVKLSADEAAQVWAALNQNSSNRRADE